MVRQYDWRDPHVFRKIRFRINILLCIIIAAIIFMQHEWLIKFFKSLL
jgi:hypothetical protein